MSMRLLHNVLVLICLPLTELIAAPSLVAPTAGALSASGNSGDLAHSSRLQQIDSNAKASVHEEELLSRYVSTCREYGIQPSADVLNRLQLHTGKLAIIPVGPKARCGDLDVRAMVLLLEDGNGMLLGGLRSLELSSCTIGTSSVLLIARLLQNPQCRLETLDLSNAVVGLEGARAIASALPLSPSLGPKTIRMVSSSLMDQGGQVMLKLLWNSNAHRLEELDLRNNVISFGTCRDLQAAADSRGILVDLSGNRVLDEVLNAVTHGIGELLVLFGCFVAYGATRHKPQHVKRSTAVYLMSLNVLYLASTLYHSFFALGHTVVYTFQVMDYSSIFILIAGTYTPILGILFHEERWASLLLYAMWGTAVTGICSVAFYRGPFQIPLQLMLFLGMGWTVVACMARIVSKMGRKGTFYLLAGGVLYTGGVPFFVKDAHTFGFPDHAIWHIFVVAASTAHYLCILWFVVDQHPPSGTDSLEMSSPALVTTNALPRGKA